VSAGRFAWLLPVVAACAPTDEPAPAQAERSFHPFEHAAIPPGRVVPVQGTDVRILRPEGFVASGRASGFVHAELGCSLAIQELDEPFDEIAAAYRAGTWPPNRLAAATEIPERVPEFEQDGRPAFHLTWRWKDRPYAEWMLVFGDEHGTVMILAATSTERLVSCRPLLLGALRTARWDRGRDVDPFAGQAFRMDAPQGLALLLRAEDRLVFGVPGKDGSLDSLAQILRVEAFTPEAWPRDLRAFAERQLVRPQTLRHVELAGARALELDGLRGLDLAGEAIDKRSGETVALRVTILADGEARRVYLASATVASARADEQLPALARALQSFRRVGPEEWR